MMFVPFLPKPAQVVIYRIFGTGGLLLCLMVASEEQYRWVGLGCALAPLAILLATIPLAKQARAEAQQQEQEAKAARQQACEAARRAGQPIPVRIHTPGGKRPR